MDRDPQVTAPLILVTGAPGTGKTTLARELGHALGCRVVSRDEVKEALVAAGATDEVDERARRAFFAELDATCREGTMLVAEAAFQDALWQGGLVSIVAAADVRVVRCTTDPATAASRIRVRAAARPGWEALHPARPVSPDDFVHLALDAPTLVVDTTAGYVPPLDEIVGFASAPRRTWS